jgi:hypothetical protein
MAISYVDEWHEGEEATTRLPHDHDAEVSKQQLHTKSPALSAHGFSRNPSCSQRRHGRRSARRAQPARRSKGGDGNNGLLTVLTVAVAAAVGYYVHKNWRRLQLQMQRAHLVRKLQQIDERAGDDLGNAGRYVGSRHSEGASLKHVAVECLDHAVTTISKRAELMNKLKAVDKELARLDRH